MKQWIFAALFLITIWALNERVILHINNLMAPATEITQDSTLPNDRTLSATRTPETPHTSELGDLRSVRDTLFHDLQKCESRFKGKPDPADVLLKQKQVVEKVFCKLGAQDKALRQYHQFLAKHEPNTSY